ncbi:hypothetical protein [Uliginosibacterium gangwonense]|uniref:hypothetical protein n=1 Tax=Uliginosibacterium gangwonense TaxID=392736 RepID=UPI00037BFAF6|nr:hypothetical protein [Uliginosibacterium gangwonense]
MEIERLKRQRRKNVQEQNALVEDRVRQTAMHWRSNPLPGALKRLGLERGIDWDRAVILQLGLDHPGEPSIFGVLLDRSGTFISFEMDTDVDHVTLIELYEWKDISLEQNISLRNKGFGVGFGALALKVLHELNG